MHKMLLEACLSTRNTYYNFFFRISGYFLKKLIADTQSKINGTLSPENRKMFIYSGHETNIAGLLICLEAYKKLDIPPYGSYLLFEVHNIDGVHGIKVNINKMLILHQNKTCNIKKTLSCLVTIFTAYETLKKYTLIRIYFSYFTKIIPTKTHNYFKY